MDVLKERQQTENTIPIPADVDLALMAGIYERNEVR
jgi:hypothetical protein